MDYYIRRSITTGKFAIFWDSTKVDGWFLSRSEAEHALDWWYIYHPQGPVNHRQVAGWALAS